MRILFVDIDTLRPDHLGCYGYGRDTSPCIDAIAKEGVVFEKYYTSNAPCLPSRAALISGQYGIHTGVVGHGGTAADMRLEGRNRDFNDTFSRNSLFMTFRKAGYHTVSYSTFAERHSSHWFTAGFNEVYNVGKGGMESGEEVTPAALRWLRENGSKDSWLMHYHLWDPHTPSRAPASFGNPFADQPLPDPWITEEIFAGHRQHIGPHGAREINMWNDSRSDRYPRHPGELRSVAEAKDFIDQYDCGVRFADDNLAQLVDLLKTLGVYEDTAIIVTSDHGENMGELGIYGEHATADEPCCRIPMVIKWPGMQRGGRDAGLHLNIDFLPTIAEILEQKAHPRWDGKSYATALASGADCGRGCAVLGQCAHVCQRSVRFGDYLYIRTVHGGYHLWDDEMLFDIANDPHETRDIKAERPDLCARGAKLLLDWECEMMLTSESDVDPMWTVIREGGPYHSWGQLDRYAQRLGETEREAGVPPLRERYARHPKH